MKAAFETLVGKTRLVKLKYFSEKTGCNIYGKCEFNNPGGSIKDRAALEMIKSAEKKGILSRKEMGLIIEGTAGNTGIGLALTARVYGYIPVIVIANTNSAEKKAILRQCGAYLVEVPAVPYSHDNNFVKVAKRLGKILESSGTKSFYANQWDNLDNQNAHKKTGAEILSDLPEIDAFSCAVGTGGTISGVSLALKEAKPEVKVFLTDPMGASLVSYYNTGELIPYGSSISEGIGQNRMTGNLSNFRPDGAYNVTDTQMIEVLNELQEHEGLMLGTSAGINVAGTLEVIKQNEWTGKGKNIVTVLCDLGSRYAGKIYNEKFLRAKGLPVAPWLVTKTQPAHKSKLILESVGMEYEDKFKKHIDAAVEKAIL